MKASSVLILVGVLLALRLLTLGVTPLLDQTEGRYGEIGREMAASGDWITPTLHGGEPFWGKPPLQFWLLAASFRVFGASEWAARLPTLLAAVLLLVVTHGAARRLVEPASAHLAVLVLTSSLLFYALCGTVLLDLTLALAVTSALSAFATDVILGSRKIPLLPFFGSLAVALLAKGPVGGVLVVLVVFVWSAWTRSVPALLRLNWVRGIALTLLVALPWFVLAERKTPGFLRYFLLNEHLMRYAQREYGDLYGHGHVAVFGLVWALALVSLFPWTPLFVREALLSWRQRSAGAERERSVERFLWAWCLAPLVFFTFSRSLSLPYVLPALPPAALLIARGITRRGTLGVKWDAIWQAVALSALLAAGVVGSLKFGLTTAATVLLVGPLLVLGAGAASVSARRGAAPGAVLALYALMIPAFLQALILAGSGPIGAQKSTRDVLRAAAVLGHGRGVVFLDAPPPSAEFYTAGRVASLGGDVTKLCARGEEAKEYVLVVRAAREDVVASAGGCSPPRLATSPPYALFMVSPSAQAGEGAAPPPSPIP